MAALQKIRSKGALLVGVLGLALFAFIAEEFFRSIETTSAMDRAQVGEVYGAKLSIQDFQQMVEDQSELTKFQLRMQGQDGTLNDEQTEQIREQVWQQFVQQQVIQHECDKLGLYVTDAEVQEALRQGSAQSLQMMAALFGNPQTGRFDLAQLQSFLKDYKKTIAQAQQAGQAEQVEQIQSIKKIWDFTEKQLRDELLAQKYNVLFAMGYISNPIAAKMSFDERNVQYTADVVALPYTAIADKDIQVTDADLKAAYDQYKENFYLSQPTRDLKLLDINVVASAEDRAELTKKVADFEQKLREGGDVANIVRTANSNVLYSDVALSKKAFSTIPDVAANLDSMAVGSVKATYYNAQDNTINTLKLVSKTTAPDSILYRQIAAIADTPEARKAQADSILNALNGGAAFADLAKRYGQRSDSVWITSSQFEGFGMPDESAKYINTLYTTAPNTATVLATDQGAVVIQVLDRKNMVEKYNVAIVKCTLNFSSKTYENELSKINRFLAQNKDAASIEKNAAKAGYMLADIPGYTPLQNLIPVRIGGAQARDCARWIFDEAKAGDVSRLYECGRANDHLLLVIVKATNDDKYLAWDNPQVKEFLTNVVMQQKKAEKAMALAKNVKSIADMQKLKGAVTGTLSNISFSSYPTLAGVNVLEPALAATICKTPVGKVSKVKQGAGAIYLVKVNTKANTAEKFDAATEQQSAAQMVGQRSFQSTFNYLMLHDSKMVDRRYEF